MIQRRFPNPRDLAPLMKFKAPTLNAKKRRLEEALTIEDLRTIAKRRTPKAAFDYTDGCRRGRAVAPPRPSGVPRHRVPPGDPA